MKTSLLITTYNWPEALDVVLKSVLNQVVYPDEILIADDGSTEDTKKVIDDFKQKISIPVKHIWHEDKGFQRTAILNKALAQSTSDYIIQIDGDCILHPKFVKDHIDMSSPHTCLYASRAYITEKYVNVVLESGKAIFPLFAPELKGFTRNLRIPLLSKILAKKHNNFTKKFRGSNLSYWLKDVIAVNGYNEDIEGWGKEDHDFIMRLLHNGGYASRIRYKAIQYHIWHPVNSRDSLEKNEQIFERILQNKVTRCENGIDKYL